MPIITDIKDNVERRKVERRKVMHNISVYLNIYLKNMQIDTRMRGGRENVPYAKPFEFARTNEQPENAYANVQKISPS